MTVGLQTLLTSRENRKEIANSIKMENFMGDSTNQTDRENQIKKATNGPRIKQDIMKLARTVQTLRTARVKRPLEKSKKSHPLPLTNSLLLLDEFTC